MGRASSRWMSFAALALLACESSPVDPAEIPTVNRTAVFDGIQVRLTGLNTSWMPREGPIPTLETRFVTIEVEALNYDPETRTIHPDEFRYRTWNGLKQYEPANASLWRASSGGREPDFEPIELENGEMFRGWLSFLVPRGLAYLTDTFLWQPDPRVSFSFDLPVGTASLGCGWTHIFGRVTDPQESAVAATPLELSFFDLFREGNSFTDGGCRGEANVSFSLTTNAEGMYDHVIFHRFCTEQCVELTAFAPPGSDLEPIKATGGTIIASAQNDIAEAPELRIDAQLEPNGQ